MANDGCLWFSWQTNPNKIDPWGIPSKTPRSQNHAGQDVQNVSSNGKMHKEIPSWRAKHDSNDYAFIDYLVSSITKNLLISFDIFCTFIQLRRKQGNNERDQKRVWGLCTFWGVADSLQTKQVGTINRTSLNPKMQFNAGWKSLDFSCQDIFWKFLRTIYSRRCNESLMNNLPIRHSISHSPPPRLFHKKHLAWDLRLRHRVFSTGRELNKIPAVDHQVLRYNTWNKKTTNHRILSS